jgi:hypothetical protein
MLLSDANGLILSVKPLVIVFSKFVFKKLFRIYNIKLYKLIVIKTNYVNKIYIKHQKKIKVKYYSLQTKYVSKKILNEVLKVNNVY